MRRSVFFRHGVPRPSARGSSQRGTNATTRPGRSRSRGRPTRRSGRCGTRSTTRRWFRVAGRPLLVALIPALTLATCGRESVTAVSVALIEIVPGEPVLYPAQTLGLTAVVRDESGNTLSDRLIDWSSEDPEVASVDANGQVQAYLPGTTTVTAESEGVAAAVAITVRRPELILSDTAVNLERHVGDDDGADHTIEVTTNAGASLSSLTVAVSYPEGETEGWLEAALAGTATPADLVLTASAVGLEAGVYHAEVRVTAVQADNSPTTITVTLEVRSGALRAQPDSVEFRAIEGQPAQPETHTIQITSQGDRQLSGLAFDLNYRSAEGWLSAELDGTTTPTSLTLAADPDGLDSGAFNADIDVHSPEAADTLRIRVRLVVGEPPPEIELVPDLVELEKRERESTSTVRDVRVENGGTGTLGGLTVHAIRYEPATIGGWIPSWSFTSPSAPSRLRLSINGQELEPGTYEASVEVRSNDAANSPQFVSVHLTIVPRASPEHSTIEAEPESLTADGSSTATITVQLRDLRGDEMPSGGDDVDLETTAGTLSSVSDQGEGRYTATLTAGTTPATARITGTVNGEAIEDEATVELVIGEASGETSTIDADPSTVTADGSSTSTITVQLRDAQGNELTEGGDDVVLATTAGNLSNVTDRGDGTYRATLTAPTEAGTARVTGTVNSGAIEDNATVTFEPGAASGETSTIHSNPTTVAADGSSTSTITVRLRDAHGNELTEGGDDVVLETTAGELSDITDRGDGTYRATLRAPATPDTATITGTVNGEAIEDNSRVIFEVGGPSGEQSVINANPTTIPADGTSTSTITVRLRDEQGNNLTEGGHTVTLDASAGTLSGIDDQENGTYRATLTAPTQPGTATITGTVNDEVIQDEATVTFEVGPASGETSTVEAEPDRLTLLGQNTATITVRLRDAHNNSLTSGGDDVRLRVSTGEGAVSPARARDNGDGTYTATFTPPPLDQGSSTISGTVNGEPIDNTATVTYALLQEPSADHSTIVAQPASLPADGSSTSSITVQLRDADGDPLPRGGDEVQLATTASELTTVVDADDGTYTATLGPSTASVTARITGMVNGDAIEDEATVEFVPGDASGATSAINANPTDITADGRSTSTVTVRLRDANGNNLTSGGDNVALATTAGTLSSVDDRGNGTYRATLTAPTTPATARITGRVNGRAIQDDATVNFEIGPASGATSIIEAEPERLTLLGENTATITVRLRDAHRNPLTSGGDDVRLRVSDGRGRVSPARASDNGDGTYTATFTPPPLDQGSSTISGSVNGEEIGNTATVTYRML